jgi:predicted MPP superfamily phosphohydrolase
VKFIFTFIGVMAALDAIWWWMSARLAKRRGLHFAIALFMGAQLLGLAWVISSRLLHFSLVHWWTKFALSAVFIWHFLGLPLVLLLGMGLLPIALVKLIMRWSSRTQPSAIPSPKRSEKWSRREFVGFAAALAPPLYTFSLTGVALAQLDQFRLRRFVLPIRQLPPELDGMTITQVSDMHVGRFTSGRVLRQMVSEVNELRSDLVLVTGDLINNALSDLDEGLDLVRAMQARFGLFMIEGNHDLIEDGPEFERRAKASGIPFLLDESVVIPVRGVPLQLFGLRWTRSTAQRDQAIALAVSDLVRDRRPDAFPILLAHHPHAFDRAAEIRLPLTLAGHTHGGQLMLNERYGFGPAMFRYWSGLYTRGDSKLIVSNGVGNWFPLRANAPAEIIHLTLRKET